MADDMNRVPEAHFRKLMQEAKDAAMADGELDDTEKLALENPKDRVRKMLQKSAEEIASDQKIQHRYSLLISNSSHRQPARDLEYVPQVLGHFPQPAAPRPLLRRGRPSGGRRCEVRAPARRQPAAMDACVCL